MKTMTGRDLILYILGHGLEDEPLFEDGYFLGLYSEEKAAVVFGVGIATIKAWEQQGLIGIINVNGTNYILEYRSDFPESLASIAAGGDKHDE